MAYYGPESGIGVLLRNHPKREARENLRVGIIGLGAGTLAAYGQPGDYFRYYEINPQVVALSNSARPRYSPMCAIPLRRWIWNWEMRGCF